MTRLLITSFIPAALHLSFLFLLFSAEDTAKYNTAALNHNIFPSFYSEVGAKSIKAFCGRSFNGFVAL
jgi:hypothetical protein